MPNRILFVDDDSMLCEATQAYFEMIGLDSICLTNPLDALKLVAKEKFSVVITDFSMPQMDGLQFCQEVIKIQPKTPVVILTGYGSLELAVNAIRVGAFEFLTKPVDLDTFNALVNKDIHLDSVNEV